MSSSVMAGTMNNALRHAPCCNTRRFVNEPAMNNQVTGSSVTLMNLISVNSRLSQKGSTIRASAEFRDQKTARPMVTTNQRVVAVRARVSAYPPRASDSRTDAQKGSMTVSETESTA